MEFRYRGQGDMWTWIGSHKANSHVDVKCLNLCMINDKYTFLYLVYIVLSNTNTKDERVI